MLETFELNTFNYRLFLLLTVIIIKMIITAFVKHEPLRLFQIYCTLLSNKVCRLDSTVTQQTISGLVAPIVTLLPITLILWLFSAFIEVDYLWHAFLLYIALGAFGLTKLSRDVASNLIQNNNAIVKSELSPWLLRETSQLTGLGLAKAFIEVMLLRTVQQIYTVSFIFLLAGPIAALAYRLLLEMHYAWNTKISTYLHFGRPCATFNNSLQWLPSRLFALCLLFLYAGKHFLLFWRLSKVHFFKLNNELPLQLFAFILGVKLGGVAMYQSTYNANLLSNNANHTQNKPQSPHKLRKTSFNDNARQPAAEDIRVANKKIKTINFIVLLCLVITGAFSAYIQVINT